MARWRPAPEGWGDLARWSRGRGIAPRSQTASGMLPRRASPASQIPSSKTGITFCTDPKIQLTDGGPSVTPELPERVARPPFGAAGLFAPEPRRNQA